MRTIVGHVNTEFPQLRVSFAPLPEATQALDAFAVGGVKTALTIECRRLRQTIAHLLARPDSRAADPRVLRAFEMALQGHIKALTALQANRIARRNRRRRPAPPAATPATPTVDPTPAEASQRGPASAKPARPASPVTPAPAATSTAPASPPAHPQAPRPKRTSAVAPPTPPPAGNTANADSAHDVTLQSPGSSPTASKRQRAGPRPVPAEPNVDTYMVHNAPPLPPAALPPNVASAATQGGAQQAAEVDLHTPVVAVMDADAPAVAVTPGQRPNVDRATPSTAVIVAMEDAAQDNLA
eukprot:GFKZ01014549.1.p1 GENE.GFKZ01014549.1~~GFKZ01014549.1.p1  ORF type:complete len:298 (+),score=35.21 GFKZ01014549.1:464-1357(+)